MRGVAGRIVPFEMPVERVGNRKVGDRAGQDRCVEHRRGIVDQLRTRVADEIRQAACEALFQLRVEAVVERGPDVIPIETHGRILRKRLEQLSNRDRGISERR